MSSPQSSLIIPTEASLGRQQRAGGRAGRHVQRMPWRRTSALPEAAASLKDESQVWPSPMLHDLNAVYSGHGDVGHAGSPR